MLAHPLQQKVSPLRFPMLNVMMGKILKQVAHTHCTLSEQHSPDQENSTVRTFTTPIAIDALTNPGNNLCRTFFVTCFTKSYCLIPPPS